MSDPLCDCRITKKKMINGKLTPYSAQCARVATNHITVVPSETLAEWYPDAGVGSRVYRTINYCTQHTKMLEAIYAKPWMDTWRLMITNLRATRG